MTGVEWAFVALGSNLGDRSGYLAFARNRLAAIPATELVAASSIEETLPLGDIDQGPYLNQMVLLSTSLSPRELLGHCFQIEGEAGRVRQEKWGARTLDLDIVLFGDQTMSDTDLKIPHPEYPNRVFWQREVAELEHHAR